MSTILQEADKIAGEDRSRDYGHPLENHQRIADFWNTYLGDRMDIPLYPREVAIMMILLKLAREMNAPKRDNLADIAGYVKCIDMIDQKQASEHEPLFQALAELSDAERNPVEVGQVWETTGGSRVEIRSVANGDATMYHTTNMVEVLISCDYLKSHYKKISDPPKRDCISHPKFTEQQLDYYAKQFRKQIAPRFYYLATPYTSYTDLLQDAYEEACNQAACLIRHGIIVHSPIAHTHGIAEHGRMCGTDHATWLKVDEPMLAASRGVIVCKLPGWDKSKGIEMEIEMAKEYDLPVYYMEPGVVPEIVKRECGK